MKQTKAFLSRRNFIVALGGAVAACAVVFAKPLKSIVATASRELARAAPVRILPSLANADFADWADQVGVLFAAGGGTSLKLISVTAMPAAGSRPPQLTRAQAFYLKFDVQNRGTMAGELIYTLVHPRRGAFPIFLSASTEPTLPYRMSALFN